MKCRKFEYDLSKAQNDMCETYPEIACVGQTDQYQRPCMWDSHDFKCRKDDNYLQKPMGSCEQYNKDVCDTHAHCVWDIHDVKCRIDDNYDLQKPMGSCEQYSKDVCTNHSHCVWDNHDVKCRIDDNYL